MAEKKVVFLREIPGEGLWLGHIQHTSCVLAVCWGESFSERLPQRGVLTQHRIKKHNFTSFMFVPKSTKFL